MKKWTRNNIWQRWWQALCNFDIKPAVTKREQVIRLFNNSANRFDKYLIEMLDYRAPALMIDYCTKNIPVNLALGNVLDMGCGTGLLGVELCKRYKVENLEGVDFSANMLEECESKGVYKQLHHDELCRFLQHNDQSFDLIMSSDVFNYIGDLQPVLRHAYTRLTPGGWMIFSVEASNGLGYQLNPRTRRFEHSLKYLTTLYNNAEYSRMSSQTVALRKERGKPVAGHLVLLQK